MATERQIREAYIFFENYLKEYRLNLTKKNREWIEMNVRNYANNNLSDKLYLDLNRNAVNGLFRHGFFLSDLERSVSMLKQKIDAKEWDD